MNAPVNPPATPTSPPRTTILLSTYNGEKHLKTQLDSILEQTNANWVIAWRDDGSVDDSTAIVEEFARTIGPERCVKSASSGPHLGAATSFLLLLSEAIEQPFLAFADQDDRWLPTKLQRGLDQLSSSGNTPSLYCSRQMLTDDDFTHPALSMKYEGNPGFPASLTQNIATGSTIVMNNPAARLVTSIPAPEASPHDWWCYIVVSACGGTVIYDSAPTVLYRQHLRNMIGSQLPTITRAIAALERGRGIYMTIMRRHTERLHEHLDKLEPQAAIDLELIRKGLSGRFSDRIKALRCPRFSRATALETFLFRVWFLAY